MKKMTNWIAVLVSLLPVAYLALIWTSLPQVVPLHFDSELKPDRLENKSQLWWPTGIVAAVSIAVYFLLKNIHRIDPKRKNTGQPRLSGNSPWDW